MRLTVRFSDGISKLLGTYSGRSRFISTFLPSKYKWALVQTDQSAVIYVCLPGCEPPKIGEVPLYYTHETTPPRSCKTSLCIHSGILYTFQQPNTVTRYLSGIPAIALRTRRFQDEQLRKTERIKKKFSERQFALVVDPESKTKTCTEFLQELVGAGEVIFLKKGEKACLESYRFVVWLDKSNSNDEEASRLLSAFDEGTIPVCLFPTDTSRYISENAFLSGKDVSHSKLVGRIKIINSNEHLFNRVASALKLNLDLNASQLDNYLDPFLSPDKIVCDFDKVESGWL